MKFVNRNILIISPEPWDHIFVSKHHYAVNLAKRGNKVFFLNPPGRTKRLEATRFPGLFEIGYNGFPWGLRFYPRLLQRRIITRVYHEIEELCSTRFEVVWSFDNSVFYDFSALPLDVIKISHIVDANQDFQTQKAASTADFCFCTTERIKTNLSQYNEKVHKINHGFNILSGRKAFVSPGIESKRKAIYAGNLSLPYIDWHVLAEAVVTHPQIDFVFIGPDENGAPGERLQRDGRKRVKQSPNVIFIGRVAFDELQDYYRSADVLLVAYQEKYHGNQTENSHKMMEYLGSGKVVIATHTSEYANLDPLVVMSGRNSEWPEVFSRVMAAIDTFNSEILQEKRRAFAAGNSYEKQIIRIEEIISSGL